MMVHAAPCETPVAGPAAAFAVALSAHLPVVKTARLVLRAPVLDDFGHWAEILTGPAGLWLGGPFDRDDAFTEFAAATGTWLLRGHGPWTVVRRTDGEVLGFVLIGFEPGDREAELGFLFRPAAEGQGYAHEAAVAARDHARDVLRLPSLVSYVDPANARTQRLAVRLGARRDGCVDGAQVWRHWG
jgi:RimJ/RimL family protein N-acetyltransferase